MLRRYVRARPTADCAIFRDKRVFATWAGERGLPHIATLCTVDPAHAPDAATIAERLPARDLFAKPLDMQGGQGAVLWRHLGDHRWRAADGAERDPRALATEVIARATAKRHPFLVQEALRNCPTLHAFSRGGLCTARLVTVRPIDGAPRVLYACFRMPVGDSPADNFDRGGLAAPVDLAAGTLGVGRRKDPRQLAVPVERHPTSDAPIVGHRLPRWEEAVALAAHAHTMVAPSIGIVGWDVAFTDRGLVIVEANSVPDLNILQMTNDEPIGRTPLVDTLLAYLRAAYGSPASDRAR